MKNPYTFRRCARLRTRSKGKYYANSKDGYVLTDVMVALAILTLLFSAIGGFVRIAGIALTSAREDMGYIAQSRRVASELRFLERAEPGFDVEQETLEYWVGSKQQGHTFTDPIGQFSINNGLVYFTDSNDILQIGQGRRRADSTCRYDLVGRRCI